MTFLSRVTRAFLPFALLAPLAAPIPVFAQDCAIRATAPTSRNLPGPTIHGSIAARISRWTSNGCSGEMPNGVRYAVRQNGVPPCQDQSAGAASMPVRCTRPMASAALPT